MRNYVKFISIILAILVLSSCTSAAKKIQSKIQTNHDKEILQKTIGKNYNDFVNDKYSFFGGLINKGDKYGKNLNVENLPSGYKIIRNLDKYDGINSNLVVLGLPIGYGKNTVTYRLLYFYTDQNNIVHDWASGFYNDETTGCMTIVGINTGLCGDTEGKIDYTQFDSLVKTSNGSSIDSWK